MQHLRLPDILANPYGNTNCLCRFAYPPKSLDNYGPRIGIPRYMALDGPHNLLRPSLSVEALLFCAPVSQQIFRHCANLQHLNLAPRRLAYGVCPNMGLVRHGATFSIYRDDLQLS